MRPPHDAHRADAELADDRVLAEATATAELVVEVRRQQPPDIEELVELASFRGHPRTIASRPRGSAPGMGVGSTIQIVGSAIQGWFRGARIPTRFAGHKGCTSEPGMRGVVTLVVVLGLTQSAFGFGVVLTTDVAKTRIEIVDLPGGSDL